MEYEFLHRLSANTTYYLAGTFTATGSENFNVTFYDDAGQSLGTHHFYGQYSFNTPFPLSFATTQATSKVKVVVWKDSQVALNLDVLTLASCATP